MRDAGDVLTLIIALWLVFVLGAWVAWAMTG